MAHHMGTSWWGLSRGFATLGVNYMGESTYQNCEDIVGKAIKTVAKEAMQEALEEETKLSKEAGEETYCIKEYEELPALTMSTDGAWQQRARYPSCGQSPAS